MAVTVTGIDSLISSLDQYSAVFNDTCKRAVEAAVPELVQSVKDSIEAGIAAHPVAEKLSTGELVASVEATEVKENEWGWYSVARPTGRNRNGTRNAEVAAYLEYGTSKMTPSPWRKTSVSGCESSCVSKMEKVIEDEIAKWFGG